MPQLLQRFCLPGLLSLLFLFFSMQEGWGQGVRVSAGPAFNLPGDLRKNSGLLLGADYYWFVDYGVLWGASLHYVGFALDEEGGANAFRDFSQGDPLEVSGGGWGMWSLLTTSRLRFPDDMESLSFFLTMGIGPSIMISGDVTAVKGTEKQLLEGETTVALSGLVANGIELPIVDDRIALTAQFGGMINFFIDEEKNDRIPAFFLSVGLEYRIVP